jgi:hypothetical protein
MFKNITFQQIYLNFKKFIFFMKVSEDVNELNILAYIPYWFL